MAVGKLKRHPELGFMLVEVIIAMALLSIVIMGFTPLFTGSFSGIFSAGYKSSSQYFAQEAMENTLAGVSVSDPNVVVQPNPVDDMIIPFGESLQINVPGEEVNVSVYYTDGYGNNRTTSYTAFMPGY